MLEATNPLHEGGQAALDLDHRRALPQSFGVEVREDQARLRSPRQPDIEHGSFTRLQNLAGLNQPASSSLRPLPQPHVVAGIAVGQARLAEHRVLKREALLVSSTSSGSIRRRCTRLSVLIFFAARTAGRFIRISAKLCCAGSCGLSFAESAMTDHAARRAGEFQRVYFPSCPARGAAPRAPPGYFHKEIVLVLYCQHGAGWEADDRQGNDRRGLGSAGCIERSQWRR